jgi:hypothetical protein
LLPAGFGLLATLLAAIGLYGAMALGAQPGSVVWLVMREVLVAISVLPSDSSAPAMAKLVSTQLYGVEPNDHRCPSLYAHSGCRGRTGGIDPGQPRRQPRLAAKISCN